MRRRRITTTTAYARELERRLMIERMRRGARYVDLQPTAVAANVDHREQAVIAMIMLLCWLALGWAIS